MFLTEQWFNQNGFSAVNLWYDSISPIDSKKTVGYVKQMKCTKRPLLYMLLYALPAVISKGLKYKWSIRLMEIRFLVNFSKKKTTISLDIYSKINQLPVFKEVPAARLTWKKGLMWSAFALQGRRVNLSQYEGLGWKSFFIRYSFRTIFF